MHFQYGLQMNSRTCSATEMVCRRQLYTIRRRSIPLIACASALWRKQWHGEYRGWKWIFSTKYTKKENAYIWQRMKRNDAKSQWRDDYNIAINAAGPDIFISLRVQQYYTSWDIAFLGGKWGAQCHHLHEYLNWYLVYSPCKLGTLSPHNTNSHLLWAL